MIGGALNKERNYDHTIDDITFSGGMVSRLTMCIIARITLFMGWVSIVAIVIVASQRLS